MKTFLTILTLAATMLLSACDSWHVTGETRVGDTGRGIGTSQNVQNPPGGGTAEPRKPSTGRVTRQSPDHRPAP